MITPAPLLTIASSYSILSIEAGGAGAQPPCGYLSQARWACLYARWLFLRANFVELRKAEVRRIPIPRTRVKSALEKLGDGLVDRTVPFDSYVGYAFGDTCLSYLP
jgi:hypothetical protein